MNLSHILPINFNMPLGRSGPNRVAFELNEGLNKLGVQITAFGCKNFKVSGKLKYCFTKELNSSRDFIAASPYEKSIFHLRHHTYALSTINKSTDIIQDHLLSYSLPFTFLSKHLPKTVITLHKPLKPADQKFIKDFNNDHVFFVCVSANQAKNLAGVCKNFTVIHSGIDVARINFQFQKDNYFLHVGRMVENKGAAEAIQVCIKNKATLVLIGKPVLDNAESCKYFSRQIKPYLSSKYIKYIPELEHNKIYQYFARAKALLFPLKNPGLEAFGLVFIEALATGTPIISYNNNLTRELINFQNISLLADNFADFSGLLTKVASLKPQTCRNIAEKYYSREVMSQNYLDLYQKLLQ